MNETDANFICSIVYLISGVLSPLLGFLIDKTGRNLLWVITGIILTIVSHCCLAFLESINPYISMVVNIFHFDSLNKIKIFKIFQFSEHYGNFIFHFG